MATRYVCGQVSEERAKLLTRQRGYGSRVWEVYSSLHVIQLLLYLTGSVLLNYKVTPVTSSALTASSFPVGNRWHQSLDEIEKYLETPQSVNIITDRSVFDKSVTVG